ncbi:MAG: hypothetical protein EOM25_07870 [Deltaproteobacteria bacterium]|nr:hypothetical protein [Deltaproteobacteria bacterium]
MLKTLQQIKEANQRAGGVWFEPEVLSWFGCRISEKVFPVANGALFTTSEKYRSWRLSLPRKYSVRFCSDGGEIRTAGKFQAFWTLREAQKQARSLAATWKEEE